MEIFLDTILPIIILLLVVALSIILYLYIRKKTKFSQEMITKNMPKNISVKLNEHYVSEKEMSFLYALAKALPNELIAFPMVGVDRLVVPEKDKLIFNAITSKYVDVCVFLRKGMKPVLVIDLYEEGGVSEKLKTMDENVVRALNKVKIPVMKYAVRVDYDIDEMKMKIIQNLDDSIVAILKDNIINK